MRYSNVFINGIGYELPPNVVTSEDLEARLAALYDKFHFKPGQLEAMTGIYERRFWDPGYRVSDGSVAAGRKAIAASGIDPREIGMLIYGGVCRDNLEPATACAVCDGLGLPPSAQVFDVSNACLGVINGMVLVANAISMGQIRAGMITSCETARDVVDLTVNRVLSAGDMETFKACIATLTGGSGAVAVVMADERLGAAGHRLVGGVARHASAFHRLCLWGPDAGCPVDGQHVMRTDAVGVLKNGVVLGGETYRDFQRELGWTEIPDRIICHQVGASHQKTILETLGIPPERDFTTFPYLGNIGTVSLPITAAIAEEREFLRPGHRVGFFGIGSGLNCLMLGIDW